MSRKNNRIHGVIASIGMALLILDSKTALSGAQSGVELCIRTVIPSLFPFFVLSAILTASLTGKRLRLLAGIRRLCRIPQGAESLLLVGLLGGYPVGAQCINQACHNGKISSRDARRMLAFCNNCGPAFLFGMTASLFDEWWIPWVLWCIHILSALLTGYLIPGQPEACISTEIANPVTPVQALNLAIKSMAGVCGWVVVFRVMIAFLNRWIFYSFPTEVQITISGLLELSNGCVELYQIDDAGLRFLLCAGFIGFGGLCVTMQTVSVTPSIAGRSLYFPGKVLQCCLSLVMAIGLQQAFPGSHLSLKYCGIPALIGLIDVVILRKKEKSSSIPQPIGV